MMTSEERVQERLRRFDRRVAAANGARITIEPGCKPAVPDDFTGIVQCGDEVFAFWCGQYVPSQSESVA